MSTMKISPNNPCPCGSRLKYKKCCQKYHKGAKANSALELMKSRYSAYVSRETLYIIKTTHLKNSQYKEDKKQWKKELDHFCKQTIFTKLEIINHDKTHVTFKAYTKQGVLYEKSSFVQIDGSWLYLDGEFIDE